MDIGRNRSDAVFPATGQPFGACIWLTGLSGAGKSTTAVALGTQLTRDGHHSTLLDGDDIRRQLPRSLGYSKADREQNVLRIAALARAAVRRGEIAICAVISPYRDARSAARTVVGQEHFIEVYVDTPLSVCVSRDVKGLYAKACRGELRGMTGWDDPYEAPLDPDLVLHTTDVTVEDNASILVALLRARRLL